MPSDDFSPFDVAAPSPVEAASVVPAPSVSTSVGGDVVEVECLRKQERDGKIQYRALARDPRLAQFGLYIPALHLAEYFKRAGLGDVSAMALGDHQHSRFPVRIGSVDGKLRFLAFAG